MTIVTHSPEETIEAGRAFARDYVRVGFVVVLRGDLGAGKTHFTKGIAAACGITERELTSPTFALANEYDAHDPRDPALPFALFHLDCYRFEKPEELLELGVEDYLAPRMGATVIEWPERIESLLPATRIEVAIITTGETEREITISSPNA